MSTTWIIIICVFAGILLLLALLAIANFSYDKFLNVYQKYDNIQINSRFSIIDYVNYLNNKYFNGKIRIVKIDKLAGDAYSSQTLFLSTNTLSKNSIASFTIVSHELGHAMQDKEGNKLKKLHKLKKIIRLLGFFMLPFLLAGALVLILNISLLILGIILLSLGVLTFLFALFIKIMTISIEKDASNKAVSFLKEITDTKQVKKCKKFLKAALLTYWGDFLRAIFGWTGLSKKSKLFN